jgi:hypothetical protein
MLSIFRWTALIAAIVLIAALAGIVVSSQQPLEMRHQETTEKNNQKYEAEKDNKTLWDTWFPDSISFFTLFLVVFTAVLAIAGIVQLNSLNKAEKISANIAKAAEDSAEAAKQAVILSDKTAERQLRAYVFIAHTEISDIMSDKNLAVKLVVINYGRTPAYKFAASLRVDTGPFPLMATDFLPADIQQLKNTSIGPGGQQTLVFHGTAPTAAEWRARFEQKTGAVYVYGKITYVDAFNIERFTNFRLYKGGDAGVSGPLLSYSKDDNEAN